MYKLQIFKEKYSKILFQRCFQAFYTRTRSSHSKAFKIPENYLERSEFVMKAQDTNLQVYEENSFPHSPLSIFPSFSQKATGLLLSKRFWKSTSTIFFRKYRQKALLLLLVIYLFSYDSSSSTFFMLKMAFDVALCTIFVKQIEILRFLQYKDYIRTSPFLLSLCVLIYTLL